ncbi:hypothetical protein FQN52_007291 [Onygenales sp. PD_12]|nr:hypothetical protein FQN53_004882 [Emmonsiellopsis sp. PD_33]KAK2787202.1 hypothetical protein FQN52_007291 [Onygenales sp. PD_12]
MSDDTPILPEHHRDALNEAYDRIERAALAVHRAEARANNPYERAQAHAALSAAEEIALQVEGSIMAENTRRLAVPPGPGNHGQENRNTNRRHRFGGDMAGDEETAEEMDADESYGHNIYNRPKPPPGYIDAGAPIHPPMVGNMRMKSYLRERRHASLSVLTDQEMLMHHAVANRESIPESRHRLQHHFVGLHKPETYKHAFRLQEPLLVHPAGTGYAPPLLAPTSISHRLATGGPTTPIPPGAYSTPSARGNGNGNGSGNGNAKAKGKGKAKDTPSAQTGPGKLPPPVVDVLEVDGGWRGGERATRKNPLTMGSGSSGGKGGLRPKRYFA